MDAPWDWYQRYNSETAARRPPDAPVRRSVRRFVFERDGHRCVIPGCTSRDVTLDHVVARSRGGSSDCRNLQTMCRQHNQMKANRSMAEFMASLARPAV